MFVLQRVGFLDATQQMASRIYRGCRYVRRIDPSVHSHMDLVVQHRWVSQFLVLVDHVYMLGQYDNVQWQPAAAI